MARAVKNGRACPMKAPQHPVGPAFERARNQIDDWRRRQIAALTPDQRSQYDKLQSDHERLIDAKDSELDKQRIPETIERAKQLISERPAPALQPGRQNNDSSLRERMQNAVADYVAGKDTPETKALGRHLRSFTDRASQEIAAAHQNTLNAFKRRLEQDRDHFLENCERERNRRGKDQKDGTQASKATAALIISAKNMDSKDDSWHAAINKAAKDEAQQDRERDLTKDFNRNARGL